jgi:glutaredoxin 2
VKALVISMSILLVAFFSFTPAFAQPQDANQVQPVEQKEEPVKEPEPKKTADANTVTDVNTVADANAITDPNAVRAKIGEFEGLAEALEKINAEGGIEINEWTRGRLDDRLDLALAMKKQIAAELQFLRELAVKEGAVQTTAAIDGILLSRQERFKGVIEELERNSERLRRLTEREEKRKELRDRSGGRRTIDRSK